MIDLHTWPTPNGRKVSIMLEELGVEYKSIPVDISKGEQFSQGFLRIAPNNKIYIPYSMPANTVRHFASLLSKTPRFTIVSNVSSRSLHKGAAI